MVLLNIVARRPTGSSETGNKFRVELPQEFHAQQVSLRKTVISRADQGNNGNAPQPLKGNVYVQMPFLNSAHVCSNSTGGARLELSYNHRHGTSATVKHTMRHEAQYDVSFYADHIDKDFDIEFFQDPDCTVPLNLQNAYTPSNAVDFVSMTFELSHNELRA